MAVMVLGGAGFIGSNVVKELACRSISAISYDLFSNDTIERDVRLVKGDVLELITVQRLFFEYEIDSVLHLIGLPTIGYCERNPHLSYMLNVTSVQNSLEAMRKTDTKKIIFASSAAVYGQPSKPELLSETSETDPKTIYGHHKLTAEELINSYSESYGLEYVILRLFNVYGGNPAFGKDVISIFLRRALGKQQIHINGAGKVVDFVHVNDVAKAFVKGITSDVKNEVFCIGSGKKTTLEELADIFKKSFGTLEVVYRKVPDDGTGFVANIAKARSMLGFTPLSPENGIEKHIRSNIK